MANPKDRKALGTGLGVLFGENGLDLNSVEQMGELDTVAVSKIEPRLEQPRDYFDEEALNTLADSISQYGVIQPIVVRKIDGGIYQIIAGERRWRASKIAGLAEVPVRILDVDDRTTAELALVENLQREDLNPIEEAKGYKVLIDEYGLTQDEAAKSVGKSRPAIANSMRLLNLSKDVLALVESGELSAGHARALLALSKANEQLEAAKTIIQKNLSVRNAEALVSKLTRDVPEEVIKKEISDKIDYLKEISDALSKSLKRKVKITDGKKLGKIEIEYYGADDREQLIDLLKKI